MASHRHAGREAATKYTLLPGVAAIFVGGHGRLLFWHEFKTSDVAHLLARAESCTRRTSCVAMSLFSSKVWWENKPGNVEEFDVGGLCVANVDNDPSGAGLVRVPLLLIFHLATCWSLSHLDYVPHACFPAASCAPDKIVTGSFQGMLRIYHPKQAGHQVDDLMLEASLDAPVLQLSAGRFIAYGNASARLNSQPCRMMCDSRWFEFLWLAVCLVCVHRNSSQIALAVLHPRKLSVFIVRAIGGSGGGSSNAGGPSYLELSRQYDHKLERSAFNMCHGPFGGANGMHLSVCPSVRPPPSHQEDGVFF